MASYATRSEEPGQVAGKDGKRKGSFMNRRELSLGTIGGLLSGPGGLGGGIIAETS
jgi:hypothetical protein